MPVYRMQCSFAQDTTFPRDRMVITPHFKSTSAIDPLSVDAIAEDLATALQTWTTTDQEITVKAYDAQGTIPVHPIGSAIRSTGVVSNSYGPRELAICLSFYANQNEPRRRGRLYIPYSFTGTTAPGPRPYLSNQQKVADLVPIFAALGGANIDWCVYSRVNDAAYTVTNWWVDNEYDIVRSRGDRPTSRISGTTSG